MSTVVGIIVEYNPLHNGHVLHYSRAKELTGAEYCVAILSGPFLQRGEPAILSKQARAEMALHMGVDLVIELPIHYAVQPAEWFAFGAVSLLEATGIVDYLCFGTESGSLHELLPLAKQLTQEDPIMQQELTHLLSTGMNYPTAYSAAASKLAHNLDQQEEIRQLLHQPNHSLALHYLIALERLGSPIIPLTIARESAAYHDTTPSHSNIASATSVRKMVSTDGVEAITPYIPSYTLEIMRREFSAGRGPVHWETFRQPLIHHLMTHTPEQLSLIHEVTEGLEYRVKKTLPILSQATVEELLHSLKTKRYTHTKLQRMLTHILLNHSKEEMSPKELAKGPGYLRILGFSKQGRQLLKRMKKTATLPTIMKPSVFTHHHLERDLQAAAAYANGYDQSDMRDMYRDYYESPIRW
ncbi:nucleotidyltransferase [Paenibacillus crassostreae]|uniref:tRNA(Met) cytidine acetate ligase n=1 Tax=Paenibacillus crassostreae TaxID=1763538 RepID=A0A167FQ04_9BACL|nr:nucleotidyltransferase [Paenibacillus crassostreae]AOZ94181.1 nucleotidyltransferase [Paenibacillus crassostreae]OAB76783.1 nucleotidyltransferase [Paenibacillus crassostreae]